MRTVNVHTAQGIEGRKTAPDPVTIVLGEPLPQRQDASTDRMDVDARTLANILIETLPGGTLDRLFALLAAEQASSLVVTRPRPAPVVSASEVRAWAAAVDDLARVGSKDTRRALYEVAEQMCAHPAVRPEGG